MGKEGRAGKKKKIFIVAIAVVFLFLLAAGIFSSWEKDQGIENR